MQLAIPGGPRPRSAAVSEPPLRPLFLVFPGNPPLWRHVTGRRPDRAPDWPGFRTPRDWPGAAGPRLPPPPRRGPREGGESRDFREPVRKDINKTNPRQHGEGPRSRERGRTQRLSHPQSQVSAERPHGRAGCGGEGLRAWGAGVRLRPSGAGAAGPRARGTGPPVRARPGCCRG